MNIRNLLRDAAESANSDSSNMIDMEYTEQSLTLSDGTVLGGGGEVKITYIKSSGYFAAVSTKYTQVDQPYIAKYVDSDDNTAEIVTSKSFGGGFNIEDRPLIGSDDTTTP